MIKGVFLILQFVVYVQGNTKTECDASEGTILKCKFPENINTTRKEFQVYLYKVDGQNEMLVDCAWEDDKLRCIGQKDIKCKQPVSDIAEIELPIQFIRRSVQYICVFNGENTQNSKPCQFQEDDLPEQQKGQHAWQREKLKEFQEHEQKSDPDKKEISRTKEEILILLAVILTPFAFVMVTGIWVLGIFGAFAKGKKQ